METLRAKSRQPLALSIMAISQLFIWQGKSIFYRINKIVYFNTYEWWVDVVFLAGMISFLFGIPFVTLMKALKTKPK